MTHRYFIELAFDGTRYHGWQIQKNARSVQQVLTDACSMLFREPVKLTGCGRTDSGVHAKQFFAHFEVGHEIPGEERSKLIFRLNSYLDSDIVIYDLFPVRPRIHARFSASERTYSYVISRNKDPFSLGRAYYLYGDLDLGRMNGGAGFLVSISDFSSFSKVSTDTKSNICRVIHAQWEEYDQHLVFTITADRFLRNMVRAIVGTLLELGTGKITFDQFRQIVAGKNRSDAGESVPACGLFLEKVTYPEGIRL